MTYTSVFGGTTIYPSDVSYLSIALTVDTPLEWPLESSGTEDPAARIIDVDPDVSGWSITLPNATLTGAGQTILFNNIDGTYSFYIKDFDGNTLATVTAGTQWQVYLAATTTAAGTWRVFQYGASTATVQPSALAGFGLTVTGSTLSQSLPVTTFSTTTTVATSNRAAALVWDAAGSGTLNLLAAASAGNNFFVFVRNEGGGDLTVTPAGSETINGAATLVMRPGDSATLITDGISWYTIGLGQQAVFAFDYTSISVTGGTVTLSGSQLNRIAYEFVGTLTSNATIVVPSTIQQYWITNATAGAFTLAVQTSGGTPVFVNQGARIIFYCDGTDIIAANDATSIAVPVVISDGGTSATTASGARLNLGITSFADAIVTATTGASVRTTISAAASGANSDITSLTGLTTPLSVAQGGTAGTTAATARASLLNSYAGNAGKVFALNSGATDTEWIAASGAGTVTSVNASGASTGLTFSGGPITASGTLTMAGTLGVGNGGTAATTAATARVSLLPSYSGNASKVLALNVGATDTEWITATGVGTVTTASVVSANGFAGTVATATTTPAITLTTTITGILKGNATAISAATAGTDYVVPGGALGTPSSGTLTNCTFPTLNQSTTGSAATLTTARTLTIGSTGQTFNGSANVTWTLAQIGAAASGANTDITALDQDVAITATGTIAADTIGFRGVPQNAQTAAYTLVLSDAGKHVSNTTGGIIVPANGSVAFPIGSAVSVYNNSGSSQNISITTDTMYLGGTATTGTRALAQRGVATILKVASTTWVISGAGLS